MQPENAQAQETGILIMAHGGSSSWNNFVRDTATPLSEHYEVEFAWGMANPVTLQKGVWALEQKGVTNIIAVPLFISSYSPIIRQTEYLLGKRDELADPPMPLMHHPEEYIQMFDCSLDSSDYKHGMLFPPTLEQLEIKATIEISQALDAHDAVAEILADRIGELSEKPERETVILAAHGPNDEEDNRRWLETMEELIQKIHRLRAESGKKEFKQIFGVTVRDDAPKPVFNQAREHLRSLVRQSGFNSEVIVIPLFLSSGGRENAIAKRLEGLDFKWKGNTLLPHPKLTDFLMNTVEIVNERQAVNTNSN